MTLQEFLNTNDRFAANNGMKLIEVKQGSAVAEMTVEERHLNGAGICQGGALFTFADLAIAAAMNSRGNVTVGLENAMTFHHPARQGEHLTAKASVSCDHGKIPFCRVEIFNDNNELLASGTSLGYRKADRFDFDSLM
ncbi:MAG: PaaI family thioesterase [Bacteroidaceae bacterium]|nr:PaaI family thioesterase [Bacteroidaceae bacterium]